jgi:hypothetical protein
LDAEFFPEGLHRGGFSSEASYARFLRDRRVDHVVVFPSYAARFRRTNEPQLLARLAGSGCIEGVTIREDTGGDRWALYRVDRC